MNLEIGKCSIYGGGSFERYLKQLEELRAINIKRVRKTTKVTITTINSDILRIESLLLNTRMNDTIDMKIASRQIEDSLWEEIIVEEVSSLLEKKEEKLYRIKSRVALYG
jgi:S-adenosylmethionine synthetase